jgi:hypothetical protein
VLGVFGCCGIPFKPKKCWGKKVKLTPINIKVNWIFNIKLFIENPVKIGNQWINLAIIANTIPIDKT